MIITICRVWSFALCFSCFPLCPAKYKSLQHFITNICIYHILYFEITTFTHTERSLPFSFFSRKMLHKYIIISMYFKVNDILTRFTFESNSIGFFITYCTQQFIIVDKNMWVAPKCWPQQQQPHFYNLYLFLPLYNPSVDIHYQVMLIWVCFVKIITKIRFGIRSVSYETPQNTTLVFSILGRFPIDCWSLVSMTTLTSFLVI